MDYCIDCLAGQCLQCEYPLQVLENFCQSYGLIEFSSSNYIVYEDFRTVTITLFRNYGTYGNVAVNYVVFPEQNIVIEDPLAPSNCLYSYNPHTDFTNNIFNSIQDIQGQVAFLQGESKKTITINTFPDLFVSSQRKLVRIKITSALGGAALGSLSSALIEIFDVKTVTNSDLAIPDFTNKALYAEEVYYL